MLQQMEHESPRLTLKLSKCMQITFKNYYNFYGLWTTPTVSGPRYVKIKNVNPCFFTLIHANSRIKTFIYFNLCFFFYFKFGSWKPVDPQRHKKRNCECDKGLGSGCIKTILVTQMRKGFIADDEYRKKKCA